MREEFLAWSKMLRENFDKMLLFWLVVFLIALVIHMAHDKLDEDHITWAREITGTVLGGLMGLVTGRAIAAVGRKPEEAGGDHAETQK